MKTVLKLTLICILAGVILSACNSSLSFTKRRYTDGYYVHHISKPSDPKSKNKQSLSLRNEREQIRELIERDREKLYNEDQNSTPDDGVITTNAETKVSGKHKELLSRDEKTTAIVTAIKNPIKTLKNLSEKISEEGPVGAALSLLWILILVLLIAYIAGLLMDNFGLGWFIHILLVVILVLLILWLLRIL